MTCPQCLVEIHPSFQDVFIGSDIEGSWFAYYMNCPACKKMIIQLNSGVAVNTAQTGMRMMKLQSIASTTLVKPMVSGRPPAPPEVDKNFAGDYNEACLILRFSPKASAALSRRCLQNILREKANVKKADLAAEIKEVIDSKTLPSHLTDSIDAIRTIGNFAAHPIKSTSTGEVVNVEPGEAEWLLDVLESLFDFYFVQPALTKSKRDALNKKLADAGKPPLK